jgi:hypothetical protein
LSYLCFYYSKSWIFYNNHRSGSYLPDVAGGYIHTGDEAGGGNLADAGYLPG